MTSQSRAFSEPPRLRALAGGAGERVRARSPRDRCAGPPLAPVERRLRVLVVAREELVHWGFRVLLTDQPWVERCVAVADGRAALEMGCRYDFHVVVMAISRLDDSTLSLSRELSELIPGVRVLFMGVGGLVPADRARTAGAVGIIYRDWSADDLIMSVRTAGMGLKLFDRSTASAGHLSPREREIIALIAEGATNREIGARLYLSPNTVKQNASVLFRKLEARNRAEAVSQAQRLGLIA